MAVEQVVVPDIGGAEDAEVIELLVAVGDTVSVEQGLIVLESDKASMEIPSTLAGKVVEVLVSEGDQLAEGAPIIAVEVAGDSAGEKAEEQAAAAEAVPTAPPAETTTAAPTTVEAPAAATSGQEVVVPDIGGAEDVEVIELLVAPGDTVTLDQGLVVIESDKASMEIPSTLAGTVDKLLVSVGDTLSEGDPVVVIAVSGEAAAPAPEPAAATATPEPAAGPATSDAPPATAPAAVPATAPAAVPAPAPAAPPAKPSSSEKVYAGPAVRKLAREFGVGLEQVSGSGPGGRILKQDLQQHVANALSGQGAAGSGSAIPAVPDVDFAKFGPVEVRPRSKLDRLTADNMHRSWLNVPHVTQFDEADITDLEAFRKGLKAEAERRGVKLSPVPFILKACAIALRDNPKLNSSLASGGADLVHKQYVHIGMAVDTPAGLVVPVLRDVDRKSIWELAAEVLELAGKARERKLTPGEMQGGTFTVSSLGNIGGQGFTPIVNTPEVGILGVSRAAVKPYWDGAAFVPRTLLPLALSYDHRVVNGGDGGRFLTRLVDLLSDIRQLSM